jgi:hypothetical protein
VEQQNADLNRVNQGYTVQQQTVYPNVINEEEAARWGA